MELTEIKTNDIYRAASLMLVGAQLTSVDDYLSGNTPDLAKPVFELLLIPTFNSNKIRTFNDYLKYLYFDLKQRFPETSVFQFSDEAGIYRVHSRSAYVKIHRYIEDTTL